MTSPQYVRLADCAAKGCWRGSTLVLVFLSVISAVGLVGYMASANGSTIAAKQTADDRRETDHQTTTAARDKIEAVAQAERTATQRREFDSIADRLATIEDLVRELSKPATKGVRNGE